MRAIKALALLAVIAGASPAAATRFGFTYQASTGTLSGQLIGTLGADNNTIQLDSVVGTIAFNGVRGEALPYLTTGSTFYGVFRAPSVTRDGSNLDFLACTDADCLEGVAFDPDVIAFTPIVSTSAQFGGLFEAPVAGNWSTSALPEPAGWGLLLVGFGLIGIMARRRQPSCVAA